MIEDKEAEEIRKELAILPQKHAACIEALNAVQRHRGWVSDEAVRDIAAFLDMTPAAVENVATFYSLIYRRPVGRHVILVCDSVSCWIVGFQALRDTLERQLEIHFGETTKDGRFTLLAIPCLGVCEEAPAMLVDGDVHTNLLPENVDEKVSEILARYE